LVNYVNTYCSGVNFRENPAVRTFIDPKLVLCRRRVREKVGANNKEHKLKLYCHKMME